MSDEKTMAQAFLDEHLEGWEEDGGTVHDWRRPEIFTDPGEMTRAGGIVLADPSTDPDESPLILAAFRDGSWFLEDRRGQGQPRVYTGTPDDFWRIIDVLTDTVLEDQETPEDAR